jgi:hypothetical protein
MTGDVNHPLQGAGLRPKGITVSRRIFIFSRIQQAGLGSLNQQKRQVRDHLSVIIQR